MAVDSVLSSPLGPPACEKDAKALQFIEEMTRYADSVQERVLAEILSRNANTEYLQRFKLNGATDRDTFKSKVPMVTYEDLEPEIQRIANGDRSPILSAHPISEFLTRLLRNLINQVFLLNYHKSDKNRKGEEGYWIWIYVNETVLALQLAKENSCPPLKKNWIAVRNSTVFLCLWWTCKYIYRNIHTIIYLFIK